jgi:phosphoribosylamine---glycine ligase
MKVLVIGSGGREHALCWKIAQSSKLSRLYCAPGSAGISEIAECVDIKADDINALCEFALEKSIGLTIVGPEAPLTRGIVDLFEKKALKIFGPDMASARLESSKIFAKEIMKAFGLPTADFKSFSRPDDAKAFIESNPLPLVIKADGLCAGKGVVVAESKEQALSAVESMMIKKTFGEAGERIIIERCLKGEEASVILISDGRDYKVLPASQDHKRVFDNDKGPNTGGMGAYSPALLITGSMQEKIEQKIIKPLIQGLCKQGLCYKGFLYIGIMIVDNSPYVLEFNVRLGDPEAQVILPRIKTDIISLIQACLNGNIKEANMAQDSRASLCVVCASAGYPGAYKTGLPISGLGALCHDNDIMVFHAGTKKNKSQYITAGGRVLGITALADDFESAIGKAYKAVLSVNFEGMHYRRDIGSRAVGIR